jgi:hypothetical protein
VVIPAFDPFIRVCFAGSLPKEGQAPETNEDCFVVIYGDGVDPAGALRAAVADGASESLFARRWAELLAQAYCDAPGPGVALPPLEPLQREWHAHAARAALPWHAQIKQARGAAAALVGVTIHPPGEESGWLWEAVAVGDSCLFVVRGGARLIVSFPLTHSDGFAGLPRLLHTTREADRGCIDPHRAQGRLEGDDDLFLMSDALAAWFLREAEQGREPWRWFAGLSDGETFAERVRQLRTGGRLRDDDVTLVHLCLSTRDGDIGE